MLDFKNEIVESFIYILYDSLIIVRAWLKNSYLLI